MENPFAEIMARFDGLEDKMDRAIGQSLNGDGLEKDKFLLIEQAAAHLGLAVSTLRTYVANRQINHYKRSGRIYFKVSDLNEYIEKGKVASKKQ